jgi:hypothetical protein
LQQSEATLNEDKEQAQFMKPYDENTKRSRIGMEKTQIDTQEEKYNAQTHKEST